MRIKILFFVIISFLILKMEAQQTVGLFANEPESFNGYTLFTGNNLQQTYLLDNCGKLINQWNSNYTPGLSVYLMDDGNLLRTNRIPSTFQGGGSGGRIEILDWNSEVLWGVDYSTTQYHQHHDIEALPNGNILVIAWEYHSVAEAVAVGRNPNTVNQQGIWSEKIVELEPVFPDDYNVVWEWRAWDHLIQDYDQMIPNYGVVSEHPEKININQTVGANAVDWLHINGIDYNETLDQIVLSVRSMHELWIIDHSTTTAEAAGSTGGNSGKGGDLLYRYGNPQTYDLGGPADRVFYGQHDAKWIPEGYPNTGKISIYNNGNNRPDGAYSTIEVIEPPLQADGTYAFTAGQAYGPEDLWMSFDGEPGNGFYSPNISGVHFLPNGNFFLCAGAGGRFMEFTMSGDLVWEYINPVNVDGIIPQGSTPMGNNVFRAERLSPDHPGLAGKDLTPGASLEQQMTFCSIEVNTNEVNNDFIDINVFPNPAQSEFEVKIAEIPNFNMILLDATGRQIFHQSHISGSTQVDCSGFPRGIYFIKIHYSETDCYYKKIVLKD